MAITDNLISFWSMEEASGSRADDHGTNTLSPTGTVVSITGKVGDAADFGSSVSALSVASNSGLQPAPNFTAAFWFNYDSLIDGYLAVKDDASTNRQWALRFSDSGGGVYIATLYIFDSSSGYDSVDSGSLTDNTWYFLVASYTSADKKGHLSIDNGTVVDTGALTNGIKTNGTSAFVIGNRAAIDSGFPGAIDQFGYWQRALTSDEITWLYNSGNGRSYAEINPAPSFLSAWASGSNQVIT